MFILWTLHSTAQNLVSIKHYSTLDGLSDNKVTTAIKDRDGFVWFGSWAGISRFDGQNFINFKSYPGDNSSLKSNRIDAIVEDKEGGFLWIKAYDSQVYRFDKRTGLFTPLYELLNDESIKGLVFTRILAVAKNQVWLLSANKGVFLIQDALGKYPKYKKFDINQKGFDKISFFHIDKAQNVWLSTPKGVCVLKKINDCDYVTSFLEKTRGLNTEKMDDGKSVIWYTSAGKLFSVKYNQSTIKSYQLTTGIITSIKVSKDGNTLFCSTNKGELIAVTENGKIKLLAATKNQSALHTIFESSDGNLFITSESYGVVFFDKKTQQLITLFPQEVYAFDKDNTPNYSIYEDANKIVWIALGRYGLMFYNSEQQQMQNISDEEKLGVRQLSSSIFHTFYFSPNVVWVLGDKGGIDKVVLKQYEFNQQRVKANTNFMMDNEVRGIYADQHKRLWVGTKGQKLIVLKNNIPLNNLFVHQIPFNSGIYAIYGEQDGTMWFGTKSNGLFKAVPVDAQQQKYKLSNHYFEKRILKNSGDNSIYTILKDSKGRIWAGSFSGGLILLQKNGSETKALTLDNSFKNYPAGNFNRIRNIKEDANGKIWVATTEGLVVFDPNIGSPTNYKFKIYKKQPGNIHSLGGNDVQFIYRDSKNQMWVLTSSGGLNLAIGNNPLDTLTFQNFSTKDGLPSDFLLSCAEDDQKNLWIASQNGISKFSIITKKHQNFNYFDGLAEEASFSESSGVRMADGKIVFGNTQGFLSFNPSKILSKKAKANLVFTGIKINGDDIRTFNPDFLKNDISYLSNINLDYNQNIVTIDFAALDFSATDKQVYVTRILGFDNVWRNTNGQRTVTYTNLPPGKYVFEVKSLNEELYSPIPFRSISIVINPPFWKTWWAYTTYFLLLLIAIIIIQRVIYTMLKLRQGIALEKKMAELKVDFFTQISHELRTPLTLIVNPIAEVLNNEKLSDKGRRYAKLVLKNANRMSRLVNQLLDLRKVQSGKATLNLQDIEVISFVKNLIGYFEDAISKKHLNVQITSTLTSLKSHWDIEKIEIIIYNVLANAIKFSPISGKVNVNIEEFDNGKRCKIEISDQGPGVLDTELQKIFNIYYEGDNKVAVKSSGIGLALAKELVLLHDGSIYAQNNNAGGLKITIELNRFMENPISETAVFVADLEKDELVIDFNEEDFNEILEPHIEELQPSLVLIVDDNFELRNFLSDKFSDKFRIETAENGQEGLKKALDIQPDLILSDVMMPKMDGMEMLDKLKNNSLTSHIPVILLTAKNSTESHITGLKYGADYYLPKPFDMQLLTVAIDKIIKQRKTIFKSVLDREATSEQKDITENNLITAEDKEFLSKTIKVVKERLEDKDFNIDTVADLMNMSRSAFFKKFKSLTNLAPVEFVRDTRLDVGKEMLETGSKNISEVAYAIGFNNPKYFSTCFKAKFGVSPTTYTNNKI
ncbi:hybrid sensor histidine kinase/response regulator transcription factor [Pedobacter alpinus]|uniref:histidine kinase n=2 Tax=Pedobacter alpinus TaxID=1590643 RepID=A0ABW5TTY0_9SPHI